MLYGPADLYDKGTPPGPSTTPAAQALRWMAHPYEFLRECAHSFGDLFKLELGVQQGRYIVASHPDLIRSIFTAEMGALRVCNGVLGPLFGPGSLMLLEGEHHIRERRLLLPAFQHKAVAGYGEIVRDAVLDVTRDWSAGHEFSAQDVFQNVSLDVILRVIFGIDSAATCGELRSALVALLNDRRFGLGQLGRVHGSKAQALDDFWAQFERVRQLTIALIEERRKNFDPSSTDMLSMLLHATDEEGRRRSDEEIRDEALTLVVTGHETTATALAWGLFWIVESDRVSTRLREEVRSLGVPTEANAYAQLEYLDASCQEILRIVPVVPASFRQVVGRPFALGEYVFPPGTILSPSIYLAHHREDVFAAPDTFNPDRFLRRKYSPYEYLPFGGGARRCIGMHLSIYEMKLALATFLQRFDLELIAGQAITPVRRFITIAPSGGVRLRITRANDVC